MGELIKTNMAIIEIKGIIGVDYTFSQFLTDYSKAGDEQIELVIDSLGGDVTDGELISEFTNSHADRFSMVRNSGNVMSIASSIFLALPREKRFFNSELGKFLIHNPYVDPVSFKDIDTTADGLSTISESLKESENKMAKFYSIQTGADLEVIKNLMAINEPLTTEQIKAINVATIITAPTLKAVAFFNPNNNKMNQQEIENLIDKKNVSFMDTFKAWFKKTTKFVAMFVTDANGVQIEFPDVADGVEPEVGDVAKSADGTELNGEVVMATGETYVFEKNVLNEKRPKVDEPEVVVVDVQLDPAELEAMKAKVEALEAELTKAKAEATSFKAQLKSVQTEKVKIKAQEEKTGEKQARKLTDYCK